MANPHHRKVSTDKANSDNSIPLEKPVNVNNKKSNLVVLGDSMLNSINGWGISKSKKVYLLNFPRATSSDIMNKTDEELGGKRESLIIDVGTNDITCI